MQFRAETPPPRRQQVTAAADDAWTSSPLPRPMKIPEESCFSSPKPFASPPPAQRHGKENVRPGGHLQVPLATQVARTPVKTPSRLPTVQEQEGQMPSLVEVENLPAYVASTPTPMKEVLDYADVDADGELWLPKVKHTFYNFDTPLRMVDKMRSPPKSAPPGCAPPGLDLPEGIFGGPLPAAPPMPLPGDAASRPLPVLGEMPGRAPSPPAAQGGARRLDLSKYLDVPASSGTAPTPPVAAMAEPGKCQGQFSWMDWQCLQGSMALPQPLEVPLSQSDFCTEPPACWPAAVPGCGCATLPAPGAGQDSLAMPTASGLVLDPVHQLPSLSLDAVHGQQQIPMQPQLQLPLPTQQPQPAVTLQQLQALMQQFWQLPYQPAPQAPAPAQQPMTAELSPQLQLPLPVQPPVGQQVQPGNCPSASAQLMALPQILAEAPNVPAALGADGRENPCLFLCGGTQGPSSCDGPGLWQAAAPAQAQQQPRVSISVSHFPPPSNPAATTEAATAVPPPPPTSPQQSTVSNAAVHAAENSAKDEAAKPVSSSGKGSSAAAKSARRRRGAR